MTGDRTCGAGDIGDVFIETDQRAIIGETARPVRRGKAQLTGELCADAAVGTEQQGHERAVATGDVQCFNRFTAAVARIIDDKRFDERVFEQSRIIDCRCYFGTVELLCDFEEGIDEQGGDGS